MISTSLRAPTVDTEVNFWPGIIDMLTSLLMFFMLIYFVQHNINPTSLATEIARQKQQRFDAVFESEFASEIRSGAIVLKPDVNLLQITFGEGILFESGHYALQPRGAALLRRLAAVIHRLDATSQSRLYDQIQIEGHTDSTAMSRSTYPRDNWELSTARALAVLRFLSERCDPALDERQLSANGYAHTRPAHKQRSRNRRIEIRIYFSGLDTR
ncbi:MAG TPA: OmpA family protein [Thermoanaerobaculia bacterium]|nr:OmpA family protein [Thermoanaerobaculia bacterium]